ncbi:hypothetical protein KFY46_26875, partial [Salmonella enterica subsp. enterica serovar 1,4,[5],12:i:-]|nr:hypothetical protein [Salmonella enterica subsp. enterica serovar 1,4,[5],12:i:-]
IHQIKLENSPSLHPVHIVDSEAERDGPGVYHIFIADPFAPVKLDNQRNFVAREVTLKHN